MKTWVLQMNEQAIYDEELDSYIFNSKYNFIVIERAIIKHFKDGGLSHPAVLAGVCEVSRATMMRWRDRNSEYFKHELDALIREAQCLAVAVTDQWHRESARGDRKDANSHTLNRRAEKMLDMGETKKIFQEQSITLRGLDEIQLAIDEAEQECKDEEV